MGADHGLVLAAKQELENARRNRDDSKSVKVRILDIERKLGKRKKAQEAAKTQAATLREAVVAAEVAATEAEANHARIREEIVSIGSELRRLRQVELSEGTAQGVFPEAGILDGIGPKYVTETASTEDLEAIQKAEDIVKKLRSGERDSAREPAAVSQHDVETTQVQGIGSKVVITDVDMVELERQAQDAKRSADHACERVKSAKAARVAPYPCKMPSLQRNGIIWLHFVYCRVSGNSLFAYWTFFIR